MLRIHKDGHAEAIVETIITDYATDDDSIRIIGSNVLDATTGSPRAAAAIAIAFLVLHTETGVMVETRLVTISIAMADGMYEIRSVAKGVVT